MIGQTAAYSPDGNWFAFTARPADESHGPDIYLWHVGSERAEPVTEDHNSVFASWTDGRIVGSRPFVGGDTSVEPLDLPVAEVFLVDPESGDEEVLAEAGFRPIVSPDGKLAIVFSGPVEVGDEGQDLSLRGRGARAAKLERGWRLGRGRNPRARRRRTHRSTPAGTMAAPRSRFGSRMPPIRRSGD